MDTDLINQKKQFIRECLNEDVLVDIFSFLSRSTLIKNIESVNQQFYKISKNINSIHLITKNDDFINKLAKNDKKANREYLDLKQSDCSLADHFRLDNDWRVNIFRKNDNENPAANKRRLRYQMCVMRHSIELLKNCFIILDSNNDNNGNFNEKLNEFHAYLNILDSVNPSGIVLLSLHNRATYTEDLLNNQTIFNCPQFVIVKTPKNEPSSEFLFNWLHYSNKNNLDTSINSNQHFYRLLSIFCTKTIEDSLEEFLEKCKKNFLQSESVSDQRPYIFAHCTDLNLTEFTIKNNKSEEILIFENLKQFKCEETFFYLLRRCQKNIEKNQKDHFMNNFNYFDDELEEQFNETIVKIFLLGPTIDKNYLFFN